MKSTQEKIMRSGQIMSVTVRLFCLFQSLELVVAAGLLIWKWAAPTALTALSAETCARLWTVMIASLFLISFLLRMNKIFRTLGKTGLPFAPEPIRELKRAGVTILVASLVIPALDTTFLKLFGQAIPLVSMSSLCLPLITVGLIFFFITKLFAYGAELQRLSDETL